MTLNLKKKSLMQARNACDEARSIFLLLTVSYMKDFLFLRLCGKCVGQLALSIV